LVKIQEAEHQIITDYEVFAERPADQELLIPAIEKHREIFGRVPQLVASDAGFFSLENKRQAKELGVKRVAVPNKKGAGSGPIQGAEATLVSPSAALAGGMRREDQCSQKKAWIAQVSLPRDGWNGKMGRMSRDCRQLDSYRQTLTHGGLGNAHKRTLR